MQLPAGAATVVAWRSAHQLTSLQQVPQHLLGPNARRLPVILHSWERQGELLAVKVRDSDHFTRSHAVWERQGVLLGVVVHDVDCFAWVMQCGSSRVKPWLSSSMVLFASHAAMQCQELEPLQPDRI